MTIGSGVVEHNKSQFRAYERLGESRTNRDALYLRAASKKRVRASRRPRLPALLGVEFDSGDDVTLAVD